MGATTSTDGNIVTENSDSDKKQQKTLKKVETLKCQVKALFVY